MFYGMPIHIIRDVALVIRSFYRRVTDFIRYRHATRDMNERYPDASEQDIASQDVCIICREGMRAWPTNPDDRPDNANENDGTLGERLRPKKLHCGHILHFACLRSWLERQQNCPTCRQPVLASPSNSPVQREDQAPLAGRPEVNAEDAGQNQFPPAVHNAERNRIRFFNLGPLRVGFGAGQDLRGLEQQLHDHQAPRVRARNNEVIQQFGFSLGLGRQQRPASDTSGQHAPHDTQAQLQAIEQQIMQNVNDLRLQSEQLAVIRAMQGELARLRIARSSAILFPNNTQQAFHPPATPTFRAHGLAQYPQTSVSAFTVNPTQERLSSTSRDMPQGLAIPDGWTLLPLQPIGDANLPASIGHPLGTGETQTINHSTPPAPASRQTASSHNPARSSTAATPQGESAVVNASTSPANIDTTDSASNMTEQESLIVEAPQPTSTRLEGHTSPEDPLSFNREIRSQTEPSDSLDELEARPKSKRATVEDGEECE